MATIYLKHFLHGTKVATLEQEAAADEKNGWVRYNPEQDVKSKEDDLPMNVNSLADTRRRKSNA